MTLLLLQHLPMTSSGVVMEFVEEGAQEAMGERSSWYFFLRAEGVVWVVWVCDTVESSGVVCESQEPRVEPRVNHMRHA